MSRFFVALTILSLAGCAKVHSGPWFNPLNEAGVQEVLRSGGVYGQYFQKETQLGPLVCDSVQVGGHCSFLSFGVPALPPPTYGSAPPVTCYSIPDLYAGLGNRRGVTTECR